MPLRCRKLIKILPGVHVNDGSHGVSSVGVGRATFRKGHMLRVSIPLFGRLSWFWGGKRKR